MTLSLPTLLVLSLAAASSTVLGAGKDDAGGTFGLYLENDLFVGTDQHYTSGMKMSWSSRDLEQFSDSSYASPFLTIFNLLPYINETDYQKNLVFALGQNIYTPVNTDATALLPGDRPYAGWLYLGIGVVWKNDDVRNSLVLDVGVVGPWAYGQEIRSEVNGRWLGQRWVSRPVPCGGKGAGRFPAAVFRP